MSVKAEINPACAFCESRKDSWFKDLDNQKLEELSLHKSCIVAGSVAEDVVSHSRRPVLTWVVKR